MGEWVGRRTYRVLSRDSLDFLGGVDAIIHPEGIGGVWVFKFFGEEGLVGWVGGWVGWVEREKAV